MLSDFRLALRALLRTPLFALASIGMLAFGIGLSVAMVSTLSGVLMRGLPFPDSTRVVMLNASSAVEHVDQANLSVVEARQLAESTPGFEALAYFTYWSDTLQIDGERPRDVTAQKVSADFFPVLGMQALLGRTLSAEDIRENRAVAVISYEEWQRGYGGSAEVVGRNLHIAGLGPLEIVGVMPQAIRVFTGDTGIWRPISEHDFPADGERQLNQRYLLMVGRTEVGISEAQALAALDAQAESIRATHGLSRSDWKFTMRTLLDLLVGDVRVALWGALTLALLILLIAAANVAILVDGRQAARRHVQAVMLAVGASRQRVWRGLLAELLVIAAFASAIGVGIAQVGIVLLRDLARGSIPRVDGIAMDWQMVGIASLLGLAMPLVALIGGGLRVDAQANEAIRSGGRSLVGRRRQHRVLPAAAMALSTVSLIAALGFGAVLWKLQGIEPGFSADRVHALQLFRGTRRADWIGFSEQMQGRLATIPGVDDVALTSSAPLSRIGPSRIDLHVAGRAESDPIQVTFRRVSPGYRELLDMPLLAGRDFAASDREGSEPVAIINRTAAKRIFGDASVIGQQIALPLDSGRLVGFRLVGVVEDVRNSGLRLPAAPEVLVPFSQAPGVAMTFLVRGDRELAGIDRQMADALAAIDPGQTVTRQYSLSSDLAAELAPARFFARTVGAFAFAALLLAMLGVYAVASLRQQQRVGEFGLRLAVGAAPGTLAVSILRDSLRSSAPGVAIGVGTAWATMQLIQAQWSGLETVQQPVLIAAGLIAMTLAAVLSAVLPAWRATRIDPITALRNE
ncbi:ABC transporter permease [Dokdonella sp.]|uniref:ABC transporter permease n=1 Tax=Dokdonella sp. TaxID=2291710 RepID=UPI003C4224D4